MDREAPPFIPPPPPLMADPSIGDARHLSLVRSDLFTEGANRLPSNDTRESVLQGADMDTMEILSVWHSWLASGYAPSTVEGYWGAVVRFLAANPMPITDVTEADVAAWIESFPWKSSRRVTYFHALRNLFGWMVRHGYVERDPTAMIRVPSPEEKEVRALTVQEYEAVKLAAYAHHPMRGFAAELLYFSGGRIGEVCSLRWEKVTGEGVVFTKTKGGKERTIYYDEAGNLERVVAGLRDLFGEHERVLPRAEGTVSEWMKQAGELAGVPKVHPHLFRATAATRAQERGVRIVAVQKYLGHSKLTTTQRYSGVTKTEVREVTDSLG